jgi:hypothetical protein
MSETIKFGFSLFLSEFLSIYMLKIREKPKKPNKIHTNIFNDTYVNIAMSMLMRRMLVMNK